MQTNATAGKEGYAWVEEVVKVACKLCGSTTAKAARRMIFTKPNAANGGSWTEKKVLLSK